MNLIPIFIFAVGACVGSFLNVVILRFIAEQPITGRSQCPVCKSRLSWWELVPLLSFTVLRGRCRHCGHLLTLQYPLLELIAGCFFLIVFTPLPTTASAALSSSLTAATLSCLLVLFVIDLYTFLLPDRYILVLAVLAVAALLLKSPTVSHLLRLTVAFLVGPGLLGALWLVTRGRGIGLGDIKLMLPVAAMVDIAGTALVLWLAFVSGGVVSVWLLARGKASMKTPIPFGPFLTGATMVVLLVPQLPQYLFSVWLG